MTSCIARNDTSGLGAGECARVAAADTKISDSVKKPKTGHVYWNPNASFQYSIYA